MKSLRIFNGSKYAGILIQHAVNDYEFAYDASYLRGQNYPLSPTLPLREEPFRSGFLFPFFFNLLPEGANKETVCRMRHIDEEDYFSLLASFSGKDFIGHISVESI